jgi:uncharacterized membrane protein YfcA
LVDLSVIEWAYFCVVVFIGGVARGFSGFGFSALCVSGLSLVLSPAQVIPPIFILEILASLTLLRQAIKQADFSWLSWLMLGNVLCIPLGIAVLNFVPEIYVRLFIGTVLVVLVGVQLRGLQWHGSPTRLFRLLTGLVAGLINGLTAMGGLVVAAMMSATPLPAIAMRATLVLLFFLADLYALLCAAVMPVSTAVGAPLLGWGALSMALLMAIPMLGGMAVGQRFFTHTTPQQFRRLVLRLLMLLAVITIARALFQLIGSAG